MNNLTREPRTTTVQDALEVCLAALDTGVSIQTCLLLYPGLADELRPALEAVQLLEPLNTQEVPPTVMQRSRTKMLARAAQLRPERRFGRINLRQLPHPAFALIAALLLFILGWNGLVIASAKSLPGEPLYPVKRVAESLRIQLAPSFEMKHGMENDYNQLPAHEVQDLLNAHRVASVSFNGMVSEKSGERWVIGALPVQITDQTKFIGSIEIGMYVEVEGETQSGGWVLAGEIHLHEYRFSGRVDAIAPSEWRISGVKVRILSSTQMDNTIQVGDLVLVLVNSSDDGTLTALAILELGVGSQAANDPSRSTLTATIQPGENTMLAEPGAEPPDLPEATLTATSSGNSDDASGGASLPTLESTHEDDPHDSNTPEATEIHDRTKTPKPTEYHEPNSTPEPTEVHEQTRSPEPTEKDSTEHPPSTEHPESTPTPDD